MQMKSMIADQNEALEKRNQTVDALQRNFETLSTLAKNYSDENKILKIENDALIQESQGYLSQVNLLTDKVKVLDEKQKQNLLD